MKRSRQHFKDFNVVILFFPATTIMHVWLTHYLSLLSLLFATTFKYIIPNINIFPKNAHICAWHVHAWAIRRPLHASKCQLRFYYRGGVVIYTINDIKLEQFHHECIQLVQLVPPQPSDRSGLLKMCFICCTCQFTRTILYLLLHTSAWECLIWNANDC